MTGSKKEAKKSYYYFNRYSDEGAKVRACYEAQYQREECYN